ncbi:MAG TPA: class I SAM-dependent methyltransferase [Anaerolineae bacterium]|nr:class I SAM-dependent methyltransferase [Anaerolineae bacterium]
MSVKGFYHTFHDRIYDKRLHSPYPLRRYVHQLNYAGIIQYIIRLTPAGGYVLDAGCGDGTLSFQAAVSLVNKSVQVVGVDISCPNIQAARKRFVDADTTLISGHLEYTVGDVENLPFPDNTFDVVVSSHVLEHLPHLEQGLREIHRVTKRYALIAIPTCLNLCAMVLLGGDNWWAFSRRTPIALWAGLARVLIHLLEEGVDEGYMGRKELSHMWRYPWVMRRLLREVGFAIERFEAQSLCIPYLGSLAEPLLAIQRLVDIFRKWPILRELGYGSLAVVRK